MHRLCVISVLTRGIVFKGVLSQIGLPMVKVYHEVSLGYDVGIGKSEVVIDMIEVSRWRSDTWY